MDLPNADKKWSSVATWGKREQPDSPDAEKKWSNLATWGKRHDMQASPDADKRWNSMASWGKRSRDWGSVATWGKRGNRDQWGAMATWGKRGSDGLGDADRVMPPKEALFQLFDHDGEFGLI